MLSMATHTSSTGSSPSVSALGVGCCAVQQQNQHQLSMPTRVEVLAGGAAPAEQGAAAARIAVRAAGRLWLAAASLEGASLEYICTSPLQGTCARHPAAAAVKRIWMSPGTRAKAKNRFCWLTHGLVAVGSGGLQAAARRLSAQLLAFHLEGRLLLQACLALLCGLPAAHQLRQGPGHPSVILTDCGLPSCSAALNMQAQAVGALAQTATDCQRPAA